MEPITLSCTSVDLGHVIGQREWVKGLYQHASAPHVGYVVNNQHRTFDMRGRKESVGTGRGQI